MKIIAVIPARYGSKRFPGKVLAPLAGRPLIEHLYRRARSVRELDRVVVATDDRRVAETVRGFGGEAAFFTGDFRNGSERVARFAAENEADIFLDIQADEPLMPPPVISAALAPFGQPDVLATTVAAPIRSERDWADTNIVKTVIDHNGDALYFSRAPVPWSKDGGGRLPGGRGLKHLGIYGFRRDFILRYAALSPGVLEEIEGLEQLRVIEHGFRMRVAVTPLDSICVDTPEDLERLSAMTKEEKR